MKDFSNPRFPLRVEKALEWIVDLLDGAAIPYQLLGGTAAAFYGVTRPINDIDLDIYETDFSKLKELVSSHIIFHPQIYIDSEWWVQMMQLEVDGQLIEVTNASNTLIHDDSSATWRTFTYDLNEVVIVRWNQRTLRLMPPARMMTYKALLHGQKQLDDIAVINQFIQCE